MCAGYCLGQYWWGQWLGEHSIVFDEFVQQANLNTTPSFSCLWVCAFLDRWAWFPLICLVACWDCPDIHTMQFICCIPKLKSWSNRFWSPWPKAFAYHSQLAISNVPQQTPSFTIRSFNIGENIRVLTDKVVALACQHGLHYGNDESLNVPVYALLLQFYLTPF